MYSLLLLSAMIGQPARDLATPIRPFLDETTFVVFRLDPKGDFSHLFKAGSVLPEVGGFFEEFEEFKKWQAEFLKAGGTDVYMIYGASDFPNMPCIIHTGKNVKDLPAIPFGPQKEVLHDCLVTGEENAVKALKARKSVKRLDLEASLNMGNGSLVHAGFALTADAKKVFEELSPVLPDWAGGEKIETLTKGMRWASWSVGAGEKVPEKYLVKATDHNKASAIKGTGIRMLGGLKQLALAPDTINREEQKYIKALFEIMEANYKTSVKEDEILITSELAEVSKAFAKAIPYSVSQLARSQNNMKQILLAMHQYENDHGKFPDDIRDKQGKALLSWRVAILPYMEQNNLYKLFKLDEPWDSEHNKKFSEVVVKVYSSPMQTKIDRNKTTYLAIRGEGLFLDKKGGTPIKDITDGTSNSIGLVEADDTEAVIWTKPADLQPKKEDPLKGLTKTYKDRVPVGLLDGSIKMVSAKIDPKNFWSMLTISGGEVFVDD